MRRGELLIKQIDRATENEKVGTQDAISPEEKYQYLTDGVRRFQEQVLAVKATSYRKEHTFSAAGTESYDQPIDMLLTNQAVTLQYSSSGVAKDYYNLQQSAPLERWTMQGNPSRYYLQGRKIFVNCYPLLGSFRLVYNASLPAVDKRRATVSSHTTAGGALTALTLSTSAPFTAADYALYDHLCIVGFDGTVKMRGIPYTAVNSGSGVVTIQGGSYTYPSGSTIANGDYVCLGEYASTHPQIDDQAESFLLTYVSRRILMRDSSTDTADLTAEEVAMLQGIVGLYAESPDVEPVLVSNYAYFDEFY